MEYFVSFLLLFLNLFNYENGINGILFLIASMMLMMALFYIIQRKTKNIVCTYITLLCHVWPISWVNIFGQSIENLQLPWFYLIGALIVMNAVGKLSSLKEKKVNAIVLSIFVALVFISVYPLLISVSIVEGAKEFIMIAFFVVLVFVAFLESSTMNKANRKTVVNAYIWTVVISCIFIIFQSTLYLATGESLFKYAIGNYFGHTMISSSLLMEDTSCATIMLGSAVFYMLERFNNKDKRAFYIILIIITVIGLAFTTRRTSIVSLVICFVLYVPVVYKGTMKKLTMFLVLGIVVTIMISYLMIARPVDNYADYLYGNNRFEVYAVSIALFLQHPLGVGYDNVYLADLVGGILPHNSILRWLNMGGFIFTILLCIILGYVLRVAYKKKLNGDFWIILYCLLAMNFIPDILNARFLVIPCMLALLSVGNNKSNKSDENMQKSLEKHSGN